MGLSGSTKLLAISSLAAAASLHIWINKLSRHVMLHCTLYLLPQLHAWCNQPSFSELVIEKYIFVQAAGVTYLENPSLFIHGKTSAHQVIVQSLNPIPAPSQNGRVPHDSHSQWFCWTGQKSLELHYKCMPSVVAKWNQMAVWCPVKAVDMLRQCCILYPHV